MNLPTEIEHAAARHAQICRTLGADYWRVLTHQTVVLPARNGELALARLKPSGLTLPFHGDPVLQTDGIALRIGAPVIGLRPATINALGGF